MKLVDDALLKCGQIEPFITCFFSYLSTVKYALTLQDMGTCFEIV